MIINYYAPWATDKYRMWAAQQIHSHFPQVDMVAVHSLNEPHTKRDVSMNMEGCEDMGLFWEVQRFTSGLVRRWGDSHAAS